MVITFDRVKDNMFRFETQQAWSRLNLHGHRDNERMVQHYCSCGILPISFLRLILWWLIWKKLPIVKKRVRGYDVLPIVALLEAFYLPSIQLFLHSSSTFPRQRGPGGLENGKPLWAYEKRSSGERVKVQIIFGLRGFFWSSGDLRIPFQRDLDINLKTFRKILLVLSCQVLVSTHSFQLCLTHADLHQNHWTRCNNHYVILELPASKRSHVPILWHYRIMKHKANSTYQHEYRTIFLSFHFIIVVAKSTSMPHFLKRL